MSASPLLVLDYVPLTGQPLPPGSYHIGRERLSPTCLRRLEMAARSIASHLVAYRLELAPIVRPHLCRQYEMATLSIDARMRLKQLEHELGIDIAIVAYARPWRRRGEVVNASELR